MQFSEPLDHAAFDATFRIQPSVAGSLHWGADTVTFRPIELYQWQTEYVVTIATELTDLERNELALPHRSTFTVGSDNLQPALTFVGYQLGPVALQEAEIELLNSVGWETTWPLTLQFDEPMDRGSIAGALTVTPALAYSLQWPAPERATLAFTAPLVHGATYTLQVATSVADLAANTVASSATYRWVVDGPLSVPPSITDVGDDNGSLLAPFDAVAWDGGQTDYFDLYLQYAAGASADIVSFLQNFSITVTPSVLSPLAVLYLRTELDPTVPALGRGLAADEHVLRVYLDATAGPGLVALGLASAYRDDANNVLAGDWQIILNS